MPTELLILRHPDPEAVLLFLDARFWSIDKDTDNRQHNPPDDALRKLRAHFSDILGRDSLVVSAMGNATVTLISELRSEETLPGMMARISKAISGPASLLCDRDSSTRGRVRLRIVRGSTFDRDDPSSAVQSFLMRFTHSSDPRLANGTANARSSLQLAHTFLYE